VKNPTKILVLMFVIAMLVFSVGCVRRVDTDDKQYTEIEDLSELGITEVTDEDEELEGVTDDVVDSIDEADEPEAPEPEPIAAKPSGNQLVVEEGKLLKLNPKATDPDGDQISYAFSPPLDENGEWQTGEGDKGVYKVQVTATSGGKTATQDIEIVVKEKNLAPVLEKMADVDVKVGDTVRLSPKAQKKQQRMIWEHMMLQ